MRELIVYGIVGGITTVINFASYWTVTRFLYVPVVPSTVIAWITAFAFAYWANRTFVFRSHNSVLPEVLEFFMCRVSTGILDVVIMYVFADVLDLYDMGVKIASSMIVIILNYIASKLFIFRKKGEKSQ